MGQFLVGLTGLESAGRVVVSHGEGDGVMLEGCTENEAKVDGGLSEATCSNALFP